MAADCRAFIGVVIAASAYAGKGPNANIGVALGGVAACGVVYVIIGAIVQAAGSGWIEKVMPPLVTGAVVTVIGLNLASIPIKNMAASNFDSWMQRAGRDHPGGREPGPPEGGHGHDRP